MAEEFENYEAMAAEAEGRVNRWSQEEREGIVLAADLAQVETRLQDMVDAVIQRFDELHERVWRLEDRISRLEGGTGKVEGPSRH
jgi:hypothetical protein